MATKKKTTKQTPTLRSDKLIPLELSGVTYMVRKPKGYAGIMIASRFENTDTENFDGGEFLESANLLIRALFVKSDKDEIIGRLLDAEDALDIEEVLQGFTKAMEDTTGNPTTSATD